MNRHLDRILHLQKLDGHLTPIAGREHTVHFDLTISDCSVAWVIVAMVGDISGQIRSILSTVVAHIQKLLTASGIVSPSV